MYMLSLLYSSLEEWQKMVGDDENRELQITHSRDSGQDVSSPKHGKVSLNNTNDLKRVNDFCY